MKGRCAVFSSLFFSALALGLPSKPPIRVETKGGEGGGESTEESHESSAPRDSPPKEVVVVGGNLRGSQGKKKKGESKRQRGPPAHVAARGVRSHKVPPPSSPAATHQLRGQQSTSCSRAVAVARVMCCGSQSEPTERFCLVCQEEKKKQNMRTPAASRV